jgi:hypothetical protein
MFGIVFNNFYFSPLFPFQFLNITLAVAAAACLFSRAKPHLHTSETKREELNNKLQKMYQEKSEW